MKSFTKILVCSLMILVNTRSLAQSVQLNRDTSIDIISGGKKLTNPWTGGMNAPVFADMELNGDGRMDLIVFDWVSSNDYRLSCFINIGKGSIDTWVQAPQYEKLFPKTLEGWIRTYDYDCDGDLDLFSYFISGGLQVYRNDWEVNHKIHFTTIPGVINTHYTNFPTGVFVTRVDMPALCDIDNDGDMDILGFSNASNFLEHNKNLSEETLGSCGSLDYIYNVPGCWGYFVTDANTNTVQLPVNPPTNPTNGCSFYPANPFRINGEETTILDYRNRHNGSAVLALDVDGDGDKDILLGDIGGPNLLFVQNCGNPDSSFACATDGSFPSYDVPAAFPSDFPAAYTFDADNDGKKDLVVANFLRGGEDFHNSWLYRNISSTAVSNFSFTTDRFLANTMVDVGSSANPTFCDLDGDGLKDLIIGNDFYVGTHKTQLSYYKNIGTSAKAKYEFVTDDLGNLGDTLLTGFYPTFGDIDGDGDPDLIIGETNGTLIYYQNIGTATSPNFIRVQTNYQSINVTANAAPQLVDVDRDGKLDLLVGRRSGKISYYHNTGTATIPVFTFITNSFGGVDVSDGSTGFNVPCLYDVNGTYELLVGSERGYLYHYTNIDGNLSGNFSLTDSMFQNIYEASRTTPAVADVDGDGKYDVVVGNSMGGIVLYTQNPALVSSVKEETPNSFFTFYPNPVSEQLNIVMDNLQSVNRVNVEVFDILGKSVLRMQSASQQFSVNVKNLNSGTYLCRITSGTHAYCQKFIKE